MNYVLLMAGGVGNRVGAGIPKQFIEVLGKEPRRPRPLRGM